MSELVNVRTESHVLVIEMCRVNKRNAIDRALADALDSAFNTLDDNPNIWAGVLTGSRDVFSAGSDLNSGGDYSTVRGGEYGLIRRKRRKPLIAAVEGPAFGGGLELALACDLVVASASALFGLPEVARGLVPTCAGLFKAPRGFPLNLARELILTGRPISADRAYDAGFVNAVAEPGRALEMAIALAQQICENSPLSVQACLAAVNDFIENSDEFGWQLTESATALIRDSDDRNEGVRAFFEKRKPEWTGR